MGDPICPMCGLPCPVQDPLGPGPYCTPVSCPSWVTLSIWDSATRTWVDIEVQEASDAAG